jgi:hypothetical protein
MSAFASFISGLSVHRSSTLITTHYYLLQKKSFKTTPDIQTIVQHLCDILQLLKNELENCRTKKKYQKATFKQCTALLVEGSRDRSQVVSLGIFFEATNGTMCPGVDSASKNEYQETPGVKAAGA